MVNAQSLFVTLLHRRQEERKRERFGRVLPPHLPSFSCPSSVLHYLQSSRMASQPLRRVPGLHANLVHKLAVDGLHTVGDIFSKTELQLVQSLDIDRSKVVELLDLVAFRVAPEQKTAASLLRKRREAGASFFVKTGLPSIDDALQVLQSPYFWCGCVLIGLATNACGGRCPSCARQMICWNFEFEFLCLYIRPKKL